MLCTKKINILLRKKYLNKNEICLTGLCVYKWKYEKMQTQTVYNIMTSNRQIYVDKIIDYFNSINT